ncbi:17011_t:CDS:2 [Cetraspora pellucida]|uniref:17011_t:CDS:1 n=1 Tax=Cetraspora pellucida TaxID=1433469 RepID=A0A9N8ZPP2_9GLOM|nr:17011_t:CDS:2 [Cetraspora pellucida]
MLVNYITDNIESNKINSYNAMYDNKINIDEYFKEIYHSAVK